MNKKEFLVPFIFIGLAAAFLFISAMVYFSNGKSKKWVGRKMAIGGLLLTFSTLSSNCYRKLSIQTGCYVVVESNIKIDTLSKLSFGYAQINKIQDNLINGNIYHWRESILTYNLSDSSLNTIQKGRLVEDYNYNSVTGDFKIVFDKKDYHGTMILKIYLCPMENQPESKPEREFLILQGNE
jgi:hypothetical protein